MPRYKSYIVLQCIVLYIEHVAKIGLIAYANFHVKEKCVNFQNVGQNSLPNLSSESSPNLEKYDNLVAYYLFSVCRHFLLTTLALKWRCHR